MNTVQYDNIQYNTPYISPVHVYSRNLIKPHTRLTPDLTRHHRGYPPRRSATQRVPRRARSPLRRAPRGTCRSRARRVAAPWRAAGEVRGPVQRASWASVSMYSMLTVSKDVALASAELCCTPTAVLRTSIIASSTPVHRKEMWLGICVAPAGSGPSS